MLGERRREGEEGEKKGGEKNLSPPTITQTRHNVHLLTSSTTPLPCETGFTTTIVDEIFSFFSARKSVKTQVTP